MDSSRPNWLLNALKIRGSVIPSVVVRVISCAVFAFVVSLLYYYKFSVSWQLLGGLVTNIVFNFVLGLLLVFRTNTAYERYWEGRKSWATLIVNVRNLARHIQVGVTESALTDTEEKASALRLLVAFAVATKLHLRQESLEELKPLVNSYQLDKLNKVKNPPLEIALWLGDYLQKQHKRSNHIDISQLIAMNTLLDNLVEALTSCERVIKTPMPLAYAIHLKQMLLIYCILLPFQIVEDLGWLTTPIVALISFTLLGIEQIGIEIENPFGHDDNDLPLDEICTTMIENIEDIINFVELEKLSLSEIDSVSVE